MFNPLETIKSVAKSANAIFFRVFFLIFFNFRKPSKKNRSRMAEHSTFSAHKRQVGKFRKFSGKKSEKFSKKNWKKMKNFQKFWHLKKTRANSIFFQKVVQTQNFMPQTSTYRLTSKIHCHQHKSTVRSEISLQNDFLLKSCQNHCQTGKSALERLFDHKCRYPCQMTIQPTRHPASQLRLHGWPTQIPGMAIDICLALPPYLVTAGYY